MSALTTHPGVTRTVKTLMEVTLAAVTRVTDLAPIRKLAKVRKLSCSFAVSFNFALNCFMLSRMV